MKILLPLITALFLSFGANSGETPEKMYVEHFCGGVMSEWTAEGEDLAELLRWACSLECEPVDDELREEIENSDGGGAYSFCPTKGGDPLFVFLDYGEHGTEKFRYLLLNGIMYSVTDPDDPPLPKSGEKLTLEEFAKIYKKGVLDWKAFERYHFEESGMYGLVYDIDDDYRLSAAGDVDGSLVIDIISKNDGSVVFTWGGFSEDIDDIIE